MADKNFKIKTGLDLPAPLPAAQGGTGQTSLANAINALLPDQTDNASKILGTNGSTLAWTNPGASYSDGAPANPAVGQIWVESDSSSDSFDPNIIRRKTFTATAAQTVFTTDLEFIQGYEQVFFNGMLLIRNSDYTTASNTNVTLAAGAAAGDIVEVVTVTNLNSVNTYTQGEIDTALSAKLSTSTAASTYLTQSNAATTYVPQTNYFVAGKNKIINGDFGIWQRGTSFTPVAGTGGYTTDRFRLEFNGTGATATATQQTFTPGSAPVLGYESPYFAQVATTSGSDAGSYITFEQRIEDARTFAGQTITVSFWARATSGTPKVGLEVIQSPSGTGGGGVTGINSTTRTISTSWARYSFTFAVPALTQTLAQLGVPNTSYLSMNFWLSNGSSLAARSGNPGLQSNTFQFWGFQAESGSTATNFSLATGTFATELAACQRYYQTSFDLGQTPAHNGSYYGEMTLSCVNGGFNTNSYGGILFPTKMRTTPTVNIWNTRNASVSGNSARFYNSGTAYETSSIDMGITTSSSHGMTFKGTNIGASAIVFFGYSASAEL